MVVRDTACLDFSRVVIINLPIVNTVQVLVQMLSAWLMMLSHALKSMFLLLFHYECSVEQIDTMLCVVE